MGTIYDGRLKVKHVFINDIECKVCTKCNEIKPIIAFSKKNDSSDGLKSHCKQCISIKEKEYRENNKEQESNRRKQWYKNNKEKASEYNKKWTKDNKDKKKVYVQNRVARKRNLPNNLTFIEWQDCKSYFNNNCAYCGKNCELEQDHFIPLNNDKCIGTIVENILPACSNCNRSKSDNNFNEWYNSQSFYDSVKEQHIKDYFNNLETDANAQNLFY